MSILKCWLLKYLIIFNNSAHATYIQQVNRDQRSSKNCLWVLTSWDVQNFFMMILLNFTQKLYSGKKIIGCNLTFHIYMNVYWRLSFIRLTIDKKIWPYWQNQAVKYYTSLNNDVMENIKKSTWKSETNNFFYHFLSFHRCRIDEEVTHKAWLNRSNILFTGTDKWSLDKRVTLLNSNNSDFSIHIEKVQITDEGPYTCTFQANNKPRIAHVYLIVQGQPLLRQNCTLIYALGTISSIKLWAISFTSLEIRLLLEMYKNTVYWGKVLNHDWFLLYFLSWSQTSL